MDTNPQSRPRPSPPKSVFGPQYPPNIQTLVNHAERFCELLARIEVVHPPRTSIGRAWLSGRTEEIETLLTCLVGDWNAQKIGADALTNAVTAYLNALHSGAQRCLELGSAPDCCDADLFPTLLKGAEDALTLFYAPRAQPDGGETLFDLGHLLDSPLDEAITPLREAPLASPSSIGRTVRLGRRS